MKKITNKELKEIIQSAHINLLIWSGCSTDYLSTLTNIEEKMNIEDTREEAQKDYYKLIKKSKAVLDESLELDVHEKVKLAKTKQNYDSFLGFWANTISSRSLNIVNKQVNIFTTNFDIFMEESCERLDIPYNDGFAGQINATFSVTNFNKIQKYKSLQFDNTSDIPLMNIIKLHGSLSWEEKNDKICYSNGSHIANDLESQSGKDFEEGYKKISLINPNAEKHFETVMNINFAAMLRKFTLELEKENSILLIIWFSLEDKHIKNLLYGVLKSNPTLIVIYFSYSKYDELLDKLQEKNHNNLYVIYPELTKERLDTFFGKNNKNQWNRFIVDSDSDQLELIDDIQEIIKDLPENTKEERDIKEKIKKVISFPFEQIIEYISNIFKSYTSEINE